jgi:hypothetical protein
MKEGLGARIRELLQRSDDENDSVEKGRLLEDLICHLLGGIPGISITLRNELDAFKAGEIDVTFFNEKHSQGLFFLGQVLMVECKNWSNPVGADELAVFDSKLKDHCVADGILMALNGITGDPKLLSSAHQKVAVALRDGRRIVVITRQDIEAIDRTDQIVDMLKLKLLKLHAKRSSLA